MHPGLLSFGFSNEKRHLMDSFSLFTPTLGLSLSKGKVGITLPTHSLLVFYYYLPTSGVGGVSRRRFNTCELLIWRTAAPHIQLYGWMCSRALSWHLHKTRLLTRSRVMTRGFQELVVVVILCRPIGYPRNSTRGMMRSCPNLVR